MNRTKWPRVTIVLMALGLVLVALIIWQLLKPATDARLQALARRGYPVTPAELDAWYPRPPDKENAALIYTNVFAQPLFTNLSGFFVDSRWLPARGKPIKEQDEKELVSFFAANQQSLQWLYSAAALPQSRYPIDLKQGATTPVPHLPGMKRATDLLSAQGFFFATRTNNEEAVKAFIAAGRVADSSSREPLIISQLVRYACWKMLCSRLELAMNETSFSGEQIERLQEMISEGEKPDCLERGFAGDLVTGLWFFSKGPQGLSIVGEEPSELQRVGTALGFSLLKVTPIYGWDRAFFTDAMSTNLLLARLPYPARFQTSQSSPAPVLPPNRFYFISRMLLPALARVIERDAEETARIRVTLTGLAVERYRRGNGESLPADLAALAPRYLAAVPTDPFDGQPLRFKKLPAGYVVYSIGSDGRDDGGKEAVPRNRNAPHDVTFIVEIRNPKDEGRKSSE